MKKLITILAAMAAALNLSAMTDSNGHTLTALWAKYREAHAADKPQTEAAILKEIKEKARTERLSVDFYDAATLYVETVSRRNWKEREPARQELEKDIKAYGDPMVTFVWMDRESGCSYDALEKFAFENTFEGRTEPFFTGVSGFLGGVLPHFITDNAEYVLWRLTARYGKEAGKRLREKIAGKYPLNAALDWYEVPSGSRSERKPYVEKLAAKYAGTAAGLFPEGELLNIEFAEINDSNPDDDAPYKELLSKAKAMEKRRAAFKGEEKIIAEKALTSWRLVQTLQDKAVNVFMDEGKIVVTLQNLEKATVTLTQDGAKKPLKTWKLNNAKRSFYRKDTLSVKLPALADERYFIEAVNGDYSNYTFYTQYTLSIATRKDERGNCVYVADWYTGEPLRRAKIFLMKNGKAVASANMSLDGFTPLPSSISKHINNKSSFSLMAENGKRKSRSTSIETGDIWGGGRERNVCNIYRDRGAYNPGDLLQYKTVLYKGDPMKKLSVIPDRKLNVVFYDSEGNELATQSVKTNAYGSASGEFTIPKGLRGGMFSMQVKSGKLSIAYSSFRVDEFVLPTFEISIDKRDKLYLPGDDVPVEGGVSSYSGHSLSGARVELKVRSWGDDEYEESKLIGTDNRFAFSVPHVRPGWHEATVKVTDPTGETQERVTSFFIGEQISIGLNVENEAEGQCTLKDEPVTVGWRWHPKSRKAIVTEDVLRLRLDARDDAGNTVPLGVNWSIEGIGSGSAESGKAFEIPLAGIPAGVYTLKADAGVPDRASGKAEMRIVILRPSDTAVPEDILTIFLPGKETVDGRIEARFGDGARTAHAIVTVFGESGKVLMSRKVSAKEMETLSLDWQASWPDAVRLSVFWFGGGKAMDFGRQYRRAKDRLTLPLSFTRFTDKAYPGTEYSFSLKTAAGVEALAAVWDKSVDAIARNWWPVASMSDYSVASISIDYSCGDITGGAYPMEDEAIPMQLANPVMMKSARAGAVMMDAAVTENAAMAEESADDAGGPAEEPASVRENFENALTFQPHLESAADGTINFSFRTSDKLSTYYVRVYAHTKDMQNAIAEQEMVVSLPVKVSILEPKYLYKGDRWNAAVTVSSIADVPVSGTIRLTSAEKVLGKTSVTVPAGETMTASFPVEASALGDLTVTASFTADEFSDAIRVTIPVLEARQSIKESHSAVLLSGMSREKLIGELRGRFVNVPASDAEIREITVLDMVKDAIPTHAEPRGNDVLSLSEAWYVQNVAKLVGSEIEVSGKLVDRILACRNADGGFGWFEGMDSSPIITAVLLERFARLAARVVEVPDLSSSVRFLDKCQFGSLKPIWCGWLSDAQYMHVRAMYASVPFEVKATTTKDKKRMADFKKYAKNYLTPASARGLQGQIISKARRLTTLRNLAAGADGVALAKAWGIGITDKLRKSAKADVVSLLEYAVRHSDGGWYYPNAVMPWRGLLESEAYAHAMLAGLLADDSAEIADGIRLWLMLQKETQKWDEDPAFVDAIDAILSGSKAVLDTRVVILEGSCEAPFQAIKASGNGFTLERHFYRDGKELHPGEPVYVGDKITARYVIWNKENRSFVRLTAPREAAFTPVNQLSGMGGWTGGWSGSWRLYRNVNASASEFFWDTCQEESQTVTEDFYVTRSGLFSAPVPVIESLYANHYRANAASGKALESK